MNKCQLPAEYPWLSGEVLGQGLVDQLLDLTAVSVYTVCIFYGLLKFLRLLASENVLQLLLDLAKGIHPQ